MEMANDLEFKKQEKTRKCHNPEDLRRHGDIMFWIEAEQEKCISGKIVLLFKKYLLICLHGV